MNIIPEIILSITVLLLAILNVHNNKRISNLEEWVNVLIHARDYKGKRNNER